MFKKYVVEILFELGETPRTFSDMCLYVPKTTLSKRLSYFLDKGLVILEIVGGRRIYVLSNDGVALLRIVRLLRLSK